MYKYKVEIYIDHAWIRFEIKVSAGNEKAARETVEFIVSDMAHTISELELVEVSDDQNHEV